jgi:hypothetical protein
MAVSERASAAVNSAKFAGVTNFKVLAFNPSDEQYEKLTGRKPAYSLTYEPNSEGLVGMQILVQEANTGMFMLGQFSYGNKPVANGAGTKKEYINGELQTAWLESKDSEAFTWFAKEGRAELWTGEKSLLALIKAMVQFNPTTEKLADVFKVNGFKLGDFRKYNFKALNDFLSKPVSKDIPVKNGEIGFTSLVTLNKKGYMVLKLNNENFIQQTTLLKDAEGKRTVVPSKYGTQQITNIIHGYTDKKGVTHEARVPEGFVSLEWKAVDTQPASDATVDVPTSPVATSEPANDEDLPF